MLLNLLRGNAAMNAVANHAKVSFTLTFMLMQKKHFHVAAMQVPSPDCHAMHLHGVHKRLVLSLMLISIPLETAGSSLQKVHYALRLVLPPKVYFRRAAAPTKLPLGSFATTSSPVCNFMSATGQHEGHAAR